MKTFITLCTAGAFAFASNGFAQTDDATDALIEEALSAAPSFISDNASVQNWEYQTLREGYNDWVCLPTMPAMSERGEKCPMCVDPTWYGFMVALQEGAEGPNVTEMGLSYMLAGDCTFSNISPSAELVPENQLIKEGVHLMVLFADNSVLDNYTDDPYAGGPYVMWNDTPWEHLMIPLGGREEQE